MALSPEVKRLEHDDDGNNNNNNSSLSSADIWCCLSVFPHNMAFTHNIVILLFYILGSRCRFEGGGGGGPSNTLWYVVLTIVTACGSHRRYGEVKIWPEKFLTILKTSLPAFYSIN